MKKLISSSMCLAAMLLQANAENIFQGNVTDELGPVFFFDAASPQGGDTTIDEPALGDYDRNFGTLNVGAGGSLISITGIGWASSANNGANDATSATVTITYLGLDGLFGGDDDVMIGSVSDLYNAHAGIAGERVWRFDDPISAIIDGQNTIFRISIAPHNESSTGSLRLKNDLGVVKLSVAGTSVAVVPEPSAFAMVGLGLAGLLIFRRR